MTPLVSFFKFFAGQIANDEFHDAHERIPEIHRLIAKMTPDEHILCAHAVEEVRKIYTRNFRNFERFLEQRGEKKLQLIPAVSFFVIKKMLTNCLRSDKLSKTPVYERKKCI